MLVNYEDKEIETCDAFWTISGAIYDYAAVHGTDKKGAGYVLLWQKIPDEDADNGCTVSEKPSYVVKDYRYSFSGTFANGEEWSERAEGFLDFCDELKRISNNLRVFPEKIVITGDHPFYNASEGEILEEFMWNCGYRVGPWVATAT